MCHLFVPLHVSGEYGQRGVQTYYEARSFSLGTVQLCFTRPLAHCPCLTVSSFSFAQVVHILRPRYIRKRNEGTCIDLLSENNSWESSCGILCSIYLGLKMINGLTIRKGYTEMMPELMPASNSTL